MPGPRSHLRGRNATVEPRRDRRVPQVVGENLFAYGTLMLDPVIRTLIDRVPNYDEATLSDWATVKIPSVIYPGLLPHVGQSSFGRHYSGITVEEWKVLDAFENPEYTLERVVLDTDTTALAYVWPHPATSEPWLVADLTASALAGYLATCRRWRDRYSAPDSAPGR